LEIEKDSGQFCSESFFHSCKARLKQEKTLVECEFDDPKGAVLDLGLLFDDNQQINISLYTLQALFHFPPEEISR
tara:strand:+ start:72812 stop:73036 length:225 start_codon:yes stop_codon:yes gene_type:complete